MGVAERMASAHKQIAISEFFEKNKHFLGFDTDTRALITAVKEAVDNALDACEEARILPTINIKISKHDAKRDIILLEVQDNGPGIPMKSLENVFGKLLYGSRFHVIRQSRGQQGIGITGVVMYGQLTTGKPSRIISKIATEETAVQVNIGIDTQKNKALKTKQERITWTDDDGELIEQGVQIFTKMKAKYQRGRQSVYQYLRMTSIVNPHAEIFFTDPDGETTHFPRVTEKLPRVVDAIKPHPSGLHLGQLQRMLKSSDERKLTSFLRHNFSGVSQRAAKELVAAAGLEEFNKPKLIKPDDAQALLEAMNGKRNGSKGKPVKLLPPPTNCLSPIEEMLIKKGLSKTIDSRFIATLTRPPVVSQGNPYQVEVGLIFGGGMPADKPVEILRFANRVPLMYQQGGCLLTKAIESVDWRQYGLEQAGGKGVPKGPAAILIHLASTYVQFTSEAKEALADNEEVFGEVRRAALEMGRGLRRHLEKRRKMAKTKEKFELINDILPAIAEKAAALLDKPVPALGGAITRIMNAVICQETTEWNKATKQSDISIILYNYTARPRSYTILVSWPERLAEMVANERGGRKEALGLWAWKLETIEPGKRAEVTYSLTGLDKGDWNETEVFYRGAGDVIGASVLDEKILAEIRKQEREGLDITPTENQDVSIELNENPIGMSSSSSTPLEVDTENISESNNVPPEPTDSDPEADMLAEASPPRDASINTGPSPILSAPTATGADDLGQAVMNKTTDLFKQQKLFDGGSAQ